MAGARFVFLLLLLGGLPAPASALAVEEVAPGIFVHTGRHEEFTPENRGDLANLVLITGSEAALVVDAGGSRLLGEDWLETVRELTDLPVRYLVLTHHHPDHILGASVFAQAGAILVGHERLSRAIRERGPLYLDNMRRLMGEAAAGTTLAFPTLPVAIGKPLRLDLGGREVELRAFPTAHTDTDLIVFDPMTATLVAGDLLFMERIPVIDGRLLGWIRVLEALESIPARRVVPGHGPASAPFPEAFDAERRYFLWLRDSVRDLIAADVPLSKAVKALPLPPQMHWLLAAPNHGRNVIAAYTELEWE